MLERQRLVARGGAHGSRRAVCQLQRRGRRSSTPRSIAARCSCSSSRAAERQDRVTIADVQDRLRRKLASIPGIRAFPVPLQNLRIGSRGGAASYQYTLTSVDQAELYVHAQRLIERVKETPGFADVTSDLTLGARQLSSTVDRDAMARFGVTMDTVRSTLYSAFGTRKIATVYTPSNDYAVILEADKAADARPDRAVEGVHHEHFGPADSLRHGGDASRSGRGPYRWRVKASFRPSPSPSTWRPAPRSARRSSPCARQSRRSTCRPPSTASSPAPHRCSKAPSAISRS